MTVRHPASGQYVTADPELPVHGTAEIMASRPGRPTPEEAVAMGCTPSSGDMDGPGQDPLGGPGY
jgi:hypothetical protein